MSDPYNSPLPQYPKTVFEVAVGQGTFKSTGPGGFSWTTINRDTSGSLAYAQSADISMGKQHELDRIEASTLSVVMDNRDGSFYPWNNESQFFSNASVAVTPGFPIRVLATWESVQYPIFYGYITSVTPSWPDALTAEATIAASDALKYFSSKFIVSGGVDSTGAPTGYYPQIGLSGLSPWAWYRCGDEPNSTVLHDSSGNGLDGQATGTFGQDGPVLYDPTTAWSPSGTTTNFLAPNTNAFIPNTIGSDPPTSFAVGIYIKTTSTTPGMLMYQGNPGPFASGSDFFQMTLNPSGVPLSLSGDGDSSADTLWVQIAMGDVSRTLRYQGVLSDGNWHRIWVSGPIIGDGVTDTTLWVDGKAIQNILLDDAEYCGLFSNTPSYIGAFPVGIAPNTTPGATDLTVAEVLFLYGVDTPTPPTPYARPIDTGAVVADWNATNRFRYPELTGTRIKNVIDLIMYQTGPGTTTSYCPTFDTGTIYAQAETSTVTNRTVLDYIETLVQTEGGLFYQAPDGTFVFRSSQYWITNPLANTSQVLFANTGSGLFYNLADTKITFDDLDLWNDVQVQAINGQLQQYSNGLSQTTYGTRSLVGLTSLLFAFDPDAFALATDIVAKHGDPLIRIETLALDNLSESGANLVTMLGLQLAEQVTVFRDTQDASPNYVGMHFVESISHKLDFDTWTTTYVLDPYQLVVSDAFRFDGTSYQQFDGPGRLRY